MIDTETGCPATYQELYNHYWEMFKHLVSKCGITEQDVEDVAVELFIKFMELDGLAYYDPQRRFDVGDSPRKKGDRVRMARFSQMLAGFVRSYGQAYRDKQYRELKRVPYRCEQPDGDQSWVDNHSDGVVDYSAYEHEDTIRCVRELLDRTPHKRNLTQVFDTALEADYDGRRSQRVAVAEVLNVTPVTANKTLREMRDILTEAGYGRDSQIWR